ncbi:alpha/beta fold hydrolase [Pectobacterium carotovorum]|uniref:Alpha/beta fold hydrolase n=1 Tax=Pectobacterium carotovorum TaxID=554 RepID=A0A419AZ53_PECCA|nr:alpha/beta hydrolase [Pectobacterium carotovorum]RJL53458.1 alpha/beta fold hydrolase [Pectobacterium carotovorum]
MKKSPHGLLPLYVEKAPEQGGKTLFCNTLTTCDYLPLAFKEKLGIGRLFVDVIMAEMHRYFPQARRHLFGHSSGAGMLLNYFTRYPFEQQADSLIMLAPELGPFSGTARDAASRFAQVRQWPFIVNVLSGERLCGQYRAVSLNFPPEVLKMAPSFVRQYSVNIANALTLRNPGKQLAALPVPTLLLAAAQDELFSPQAIRNLVEKHGSDLLEFRCIEDSTHLVCVFEAHCDIHQYVVGMRQGA